MTLNEMYTQSTESQQKLCLGKTSLLPFFLVHVRSKELWQWELSVTCEPEHDGQD